MGALLLGFIFAFLFAPCAIAPFLVLLEAILIGNSIAPITMIVAFSAGLFTPFAVFSALRDSALERRLLRYAGIVQKTGGILLIVFGIWLILTA
jgi:cytochrome c biogenesis protein CcdA